MPPAPPVPPVLPPPPPPPNPVSPRSPADPARLSPALPPLPEPPRLVVVAVLVVSTELESLLVLPLDIAPPEAVAARFPVVLIPPKVPPAPGVSNV